MILGINTAESVHELCLVKDTAVLAEASWAANRDDIDRLVPTLQQLLGQAGQPKEAITAIFVVCGPGSFTAVRTGVAFANALAEGLGVPLHALRTFELLEYKWQGPGEAHIVLPAGRKELALWQQGNYEFKPEAEVPPMNPEHFKSLGTVLAEGLTNELEAQSLVEVFYMRDPNITLSSNPWKKA